MPPPSVAKLPPTGRTSGRRPWLLAAVVALWGGCSQPRGTQEAGPGRVPQVVLYPAGGGPQAIVKVELARTPDEHTRGLMFRRSLGPDAGMLFLFDRAEVRRFWMKNTYIPLDMLFLDDQRRVVGIIEQAIPHDEHSRGPDEPARYVLEVQGGFARRHGLGQGARADFIDVME